MASIDVGGALAGWHGVEALRGALLSLPSWQGLLIVALTSLAVARLDQVVGDPVVTRLIRIISGQVDDVVLRYVHPALYVTTLVSGLYFSTLLSRSTQVPRTR